MLLMFAAAAAAALDWTTPVFAIVHAALGLAGAWLSLHAGLWLNDHIHGERAQRALTRAKAAAVDVVKELEQTLVPEIKAALADGKLTKEEGARLREIAIARIRNSLGTRGLAWLREATGLLTVDEHLGTLVEATVLDLKRAAPVSAAVLDEYRGPPPLPSSATLESTAGQGVAR